jgi:hypothetical protein
MGRAGYVVTSIVNAAGYASPHRWGGRTRRVPHPLIPAQAGIARERYTPSTKITR